MGKRRAAARTWIQLQHQRRHQLFKHPQAKLHLYGKRHARPGRKMGHYNCLAEDADKAMQLAEAVRKEISPGNRN